METNLLAPILLSQAAMPHLGRGSAIVNVASLAGKVPVPDEATYSATKAGLRAFTRALSFEARARGIHLATVCPEPVDTGFFGDVSAVPDLVFSQPMSSAAQVADAVLRAVDEHVAEIDVPSLSGTLATAGYVAPALFTRLRPLRCFGWCVWPLSDRPSYRLSREILVGVTGFEPVTSTV